MPRCLFVVGLLIALGLIHGDMARAEPHAAVTIQGFSFSPSPITIELGESITWTNLDASAHTATSDTNGVFDSGTLASQGTFSFTPTMTGTIEYHCAFHSSMQASIVVVAPLDHLIFVPSMLKSTR